MRQGRQLLPSGAADDVPLGSRDADVAPSVVQLYGGSFDATFDVISLCSGFGVLDVLDLNGDPNGENGENRVPGVDGSVPDGIDRGFFARASTAYESMEQWAARHTESHELALRGLERKQTRCFAVEAVGLEVRG